MGIDRFDAADLAALFVEVKTVARLSVDGVAISGPGQPWAG
jgi:hypothetical protein